MRFFPARADVGLLVLRVWIGATLFLRHGWEKRPGQWQHFVTNFPDPVGIGSYASFVVAFADDFLCALLLVVGLSTRWVALFCFANIFVAWALVHHFKFFGKDPGGDHGELIVLYLGALLTIALAGGGRASLDSWMLRGTDRTLENSKTYTSDSKSWVRTMRGDDDRKRNT